ncbi:MAG: DUF4276 family protein [Bryobacteraceae bacterium]|nr:DUF4276 family protein [Bryobacteraceae bacterium]
MIKRIVPIVEGEGEVLAVPKLLHRLMNECGMHTHVVRPYRMSRSKLSAPDVFESKIEQAALDAGGNGAIIVLLDSDHLTQGEAPPCVLGPRLLARAQAVRSDRRMLICLAEIEFESWFIAAAESLAGCERLPLGLSRPANFEKIRGAKEWLSNQIEGPYKYKPTANQAALVQHMDLALAREHSHSFRRFCDRFRALLAG